MVTMETVIREMYSLSSINLLALLTFLQDGEHIFFFEKVQPVRFVFTFHKFIRSLVTTGVLKEFGTTDIFI